MIKKVGILFSLIFLLVRPLAAQQIYPSHQATIFGKVNLISCTTALRKTGPIYLGVAFTPDPGWQLDQVDLSVHASDNTPVEIFTPFEQPYNPEIIYPISAVLLEKPNHPISFMVEGSVRACFHSACALTPIRLALTLEPKIAAITPECGALSLALANTPIPMHAKRVNGWAVPEQDGVRITLDFPKIPRSLMIYDVNKNPLHLDIQTKAKRVSFLWPEPTGSFVHFYARTHYHYYSIDLNVLPPGTPVPPPPVSLFSIFQACLLFFLLSAAPIFWARTTIVSQKKFHSDTKQIMRLTVTVTVAMLILLYTRGLLPLTYVPLSKTNTLIAMGLGLLFVPASPLLVALFVFLTPKPYFMPFVECNIITQVCIIMGCAGISLLAFLIQLLYEKQIFRVLQGNKNISLIWWSCRLPWIGLMLYTYFYL